MSKKHFELLAAAISCIESVENRLKMAQAISDICKESNPRFNYGLFLKACGITVAK